MCGIVGYVGERNATDIIYNGLKQLEYRGYDSAGIALWDNNKISVVKKQGKVNCLENLIGGLKGKAGIGHTRWATHGKPSDNNAHPHTSGKFALVHNGIIENYAELKEKYLNGVSFSSDTDSEIIVKLLDKFYRGDVILTVKKVCAMLKGSYALAILCENIEGIIVTKRNNPAIIGYGKDGNFVASDSPALSECKRITILQDGDIALITKDGVNIFDQNLQGVIRERLKNYATPASLSLDGCPHYMLKEIREVPASVQQTCNAYTAVEQRLCEVLKGVNRIIITGCGTAYNSGLIAKSYIENFAKIPVEVETAGELRYKNPIVTQNTVLIAISQSGETADTLEASRLFKNLGARVVAVTNSPYSELTRCADAVVPVCAGAEICVAATKSYTGQIAALYMLANTLAGIPAKTAAQKLSVMPELCEKTINLNGITQLADTCARSDGVYFLGRALDYAVALEGSLKLKEVSYIPSEGYAAGELKHGTLALIDIKSTAVVLITDESLAAKSENAVEQVLSRRGKVAVISNIDAIEKALGDRVQVIKIPECDKYLSPLLTAVVLQLLAYKTALLLDRDPDKPRNLAKSVTVE